MADSDFSLDNDSMEIQNLTIDDPEIVSYFQNIEVTNENLKEKIEYLLKLGILSSKSAQMGNQTDYIDRKLTETLYKLKEHVEEELPSDESIRKIFQELLFQLGMIKGESEEHLKGTQKGFEFEEYCEKTLSSIAKMFGDRLEKTGETLGSLGV